MTGGLATALFFVVDFRGWATEVFVVFVFFFFLVVFFAFFTVLPPFADFKASKSIASSSVIFSESISSGIVAFVEPYFTYGP